MYINIYIYIIYKYVYIYIYKCIYIHTHSQSHLEEIGERASIHKLENDPQAAIIHISFNVFRHLRVLTAQ